MNKTLLAVGLALASGPAQPLDTDPDQTAEHIESQCAEKWDTNYRMVKHCMDSHEEAVQAVGALWESYDEGAEERVIIDRCFAKWTDDQSRPNWRMVGHCSERQIEAYQELSAD